MRGYWLASHLESSQWDFSIKFSTLHYGSLISKDAWPCIFSISSKIISRSFRLNKIILFYLKFQKIMTTPHLGVNFFWNLHPLLHIAHALLFDNKRLFICFTISGLHQELLKEMYLHCNVINLHKLLNRNMTNKT